MIKFHELRIGNTVKCKKSNDAGLYHVLHLDGWLLKIGLDGARQGEWYEQEHIRPIKLTPELLGKCGFEFDGACFENEGLKLWKDNLKGFYISNNAFTVYLDYLHQLQNLTFALTGTELSINAKR